MMRVINSTIVNHLTLYLLNCMCRTQHFRGGSQRGACSDYKAGYDDLYSYDFIRQFRLDLVETKYPGVTRVCGSNRMQTAYRLKKDADLTLPTRTVFPQGLSAQFSFICTFRNRKIPKTPWHLIRVTDIETKPQFIVALNPRRQTIEFSIADYEGKLQTLVFNNVNVFDKNWHKIHFRVSRQNVLLYIDSQIINKKLLDARAPIDMNGQISVSKLLNSKQTHPASILNSDSTWWRPSILVLQEFVALIGCRRPIAWRRMRI